MSNRRITKTLKARDQKLALFLHLSGPPPPLPHMVLVLTGGNWGRIPLNFLVESEEGLPRTSLSMCGFQSLRFAFVASELTLKPGMARVAALATRAVDR